MYIIYSSLLILVIQSRQAQVLLFCFVLFRVIPARYRVCIHMYTCMHALVEPLLIKDTSKCVCVCVCVVYCIVHVHVHVHVHTRMSSSLITCRSSKTGHRHPVVEAPAGSETLHS